MLYRDSGQCYRSMYTVFGRKCVKLVYRLLVLFLVTQCVESSKKPSYSPVKYPSYPVATTPANKYTTAKKPKTSSESSELLNIIEDQSKLATPEVHPTNHDPCVLGPADLYLQWWINENGSLALPEDMGTWEYFFICFYFG